MITFSVWFEGQRRSYEGKITWGTIDLVLGLRETMRCSSLKNDLLF